MPVAPVVWLVTNPPVAWCKNPLGFLPLSRAYSIHDERVVLGVCWSGVEGVISVEPVRRIIGLFVRRIVRAELIHYGLIDLAILQYMLTLYHVK